MTYLPSGPTFFSLPAGWRDDAYYNAYTLNGGGFRMQMGVPGALVRNAYDEGNYYALDGGNCFVSFTLSIEPGSGPGAASEELQFYVGTASAAVNIFVHPVAREGLPARIDVGETYTGNVVSIPYTGGDIQVFVSFPEGQYPNVAVNGTAVGLGQGTTFPRPRNAFVSFFTQGNPSDSFDPHEYGYAQVNNLTISSWTPPAVPGTFSIALESGVWLEIPLRIGQYWAGDEFDPAEAYWSQELHITPL